MKLCRFWSTICSTLKWQSYRISRRSVRCERNSFNDIPPAFSTASRYWIGNNIAQAVARHYPDAQPLPNHIINNCPHRKTNRVELVMSISLPLFIDSKRNLWLAMNTFGGRIPSHKASSVVEVYSIWNIVAWEVLACSHCDFVSYCSRTLMSRSVIIHLVKHKLFRFFWVKRLYSLPAACEPKLFATLFDSSRPSKEYDATWADAKYLKVMCTSFQSHILRGATQRSVIKPRWYFFRASCSTGLSADTRTMWR